MRIVLELNDLYKVRNQGYGDSFVETIHEFGMVAAACQLSHKMNRFKSLIKIGATPVTMRDSLIDLANYAVITLMEIDKQEGDQ